MVETCAWGQRRPAACTPGGHRYTHGGVGSTGPVGSGRVPAFVPPPRYVAPSPHDGGGGGVYGPVPFSSPSPLGRRGPRWLCPRLRRPNLPPYGPGRIGTRGFAVPTGPCPPQADWGSGGTPNPPPGLLPRRSETVGELYPMPPQAPFFSALPLGQGLSPRPGATAAGAKLPGPSVPTPLGLASSAKGRRVGRGAWALAFCLDRPLPRKDAVAAGGQVPPDSPSSGLAPQIGSLPRAAGPFPHPRRRAVGAREWTRPAEPAEAGRDGKATRRRRRAQASVQARGSGAGGGAEAGRPRGTERRPAAPRGLRRRPPPRHAGAEGLSPPLPRPSPLSSRPLPRHADAGFGPRLARRPRPDPPGTPPGAARTAGWGWVRGRWAPFPLPEASPAGETALGLLANL